MATKSLKKAETLKVTGYRQPGPKKDFLKYSNKAKLAVSDTTNPKEVIIKHGVAAKNKQAQVVAGKKRRASNKQKFSW